jgi:hypothetical protein
MMLYQAASGGNGGGATAALGACQNMPLFNPWRFGAALL